MMVFLVAEFHYFAISLILVCYLDEATRVAYCANASDRNWPVQSEDARYRFASAGTSVALSLV